MSTTLADWSCTKVAGMSTTEPVEVIADRWDEFDAPPSVVRSLPGTAPIVPKDSIAGRSLTAVVAILTFLASLTTGVAMLAVRAGTHHRRRRARGVRYRARDAGHCRYTSIHQGRGRASGRAMARQRTLAR